MSSQMMLVETLAVMLVEFDNGQTVRGILADLMEDTDPVFYDLDIRMLRSNIRLTQIPRTVRPLSNSTNMTAKVSTNIIWLDILNLL
jgi:hypothetical protein